MTPNDCRALADLLFPAELPTREELERRYPPRNSPEGARVTRFAPSPTGFLHFGSLYAAFVYERMAHTSPGGVFYLRIEDTDSKREVEDGVARILEGLDAFDIPCDEGPVSEDEESGVYGPYRQSKRLSIYHGFARWLVENGRAYPCFCTEEELATLRAGQEAETIRTGYRGEFARCRDLPLDEIRARLKAKPPHVLRLRSEGDERRRVTLHDEIRGDIELPENDQDIVLLKSEGISLGLPTYHFAHVVDDYLMRTTHVTRGDEWIASANIHLELFRAIGVKPPKFVHIAPLMKMDGESKRKLSKRKDPEADVSYYVNYGYPAAAVKEYLLGIAASDFEDWRRANPAAPLAAFPFKLKKMSASGALFDIVKLGDVSKQVISRMAADEVLASVLMWAKQYDKDFHSLLARDLDYARGIFAIDRGGAKPRKDIAKWSDAPDYAAYFFDETFQMRDPFPDNLSREDTAGVLAAYYVADILVEDSDSWFSNMKELCISLDFSPDVKAYKQHPDAFKGHVGDVSGVIRVAVTGRRNTPDLCAIMRLLGRERVHDRINKALRQLG